MEQRRGMTLAERVKLHPMKKTKKIKSTGARGKQSKQERNRSKAHPTPKLARKKPGRAQQSKGPEKKASRKKRGGRG
jgi:hypothetical protein